MSHTAEIPELSPMTLQYRDAETLETVMSAQHGQSRSSDLLSQLQEHLALHADDGGRMTLFGQDAAYSETLLRAARDTGRFVTGEGSTITLSRRQRRAAAGVLMHVGEELDETVLPPSRTDKLITDGLAHMVSYARRERRVSRALGRVLHPRAV